jgi:hypothetical protein
MFLFDPRRSDVPATRATISEAAFGRFHDTVITQNCGNARKEAGR